MDNPYLDIDRLMAGDIYTSSETMDSLTILCDDFGSRFGGTAGERKAAEFIKDKLIAYGLSNVALEPVEYVSWQRGETKLKLTAPIERELPCISLPHSPPASLDGEIIDLGDGGPDDFEKLSEKIPGKIVMVNSKTRPRGATRWIHRSEKYGRALMAGAIGFIFVNHYPGYGPATGGIGNNAEAPIPGISVSYEDGKAIQRIMKRHGSVSIHLESTDSCSPGTSWNVSGEIPGSDPEAQIVMLGCHYDGHDISQGAEDPASGAVAVMEAARVLAKHAGSLPHTLRFVLWGVEEIGLIGSRQYVEDHADELGQIRFYFNMDGAGSIKQKDVVLNEWQALEQLFTKWREQMALDYEVGQSMNAHSDHYPFLMAGVPTGGMDTADKVLTGRGYGHTKFDTLDKVFIRGLQEAADMAARLALRLASVEEWPVQHRNEEEVKALFQKPTYQEAKEITEKIRAYRESLLAQK